MKEQDYTVYQFSIREWICFSLLYFGGLFCAGYLFFRSLLMAVAITPLAIFLLKQKREKLQLDRAKEIRNQFSDVLQVLSVSLGAGNSFEKAFTEAIYELELLYGTRQEIMIRELELLAAKCAMNQSIEVGLQSLAERTDCDEIKSFQSAVALCRSSGGNIVEIVRNTNQTILQKNEIEDDIAVICAQQRISFQILMCMPFAIVILMNVVSADYMEALFTPAGRLIVFCVLFVLLLAYCMGNWILREGKKLLKTYRPLLADWPCFRKSNSFFLRLTDKVTMLLRRYAPERKFRLLFAELFEQEGDLFYRQHRCGQLLATILILLGFVLLAMTQWKWELLFLLIGLEAAVWVLPDRNLQERALKRRSMIEEELPGVLSKLAILTDAGITVKSAIEKITVQMSANELQKQLELLQQDFISGKSDGLCFERFAGRCRTKGTSALATLLLQNIRKGGRELSSLLRLHARAGWEKRKAEVKIKGEEKAVKLMLPTMLVFICLMVLMAAPAVMNMNLF